MRKKLRKIDGQRLRFVGTFKRFGWKNGYKGPLKTVLLTDVALSDSGEVVTDHLWFNLTKGFEALGLEEGDTVAFDARVTEYVRGYKGHVFERQIEAPLEIDYKLERPTKIEKLSRS